MVFSLSSTKKLAIALLLSTTINYSIGAQLRGQENIDSNNQQPHRQREQINDETETLEAMTNRAQYSAPTLGFRLYENTYQEGVDRILKSGDIADKNSTKVFLEKNNRIINGQSAKHPYKSFAVILDVRDGRVFSSGCTGTLIEEDIIITAAHCAYGRQDAFDRAYINAFAPSLGNQNPATGEFYPRDILDVSNPQIDVFIHPKFIPTTNPPFDFALVKLASKSSLPPATLPDWTEDYSKDQQFTIVGFGRQTVDSPSTPPTILQTGTVSYVPNYVCKKTGMNIKHSMICAKGENYSVDACYGDSGGPLYIKDIEGKEKIVGITSWGVGCASDGYPGVYSRITSALPWIYRTICTQSASSNAQSWCDALALHNKS